MIAFVEAIAGMMFFTTPCVRDQVTPSILNSFARARAMAYSHPICSGSSVSSFLSVAMLRIISWAEKASQRLPPCTFGHSRTEAHSMQCSGSRGVLAMVQIGKAVGLFNMSSEHS